MSDQPTGTHPAADEYPRDPLAEPTLPSDALSSEPYPSGPSESGRDETQRLSAQTAVTEPAPHEQPNPSVPPAPALAPPVPAPAVPYGFDAGPADGPPADTAQAGQRFSPVLKRVGFALIAVVVVVLGRTAFDRGSADVLEVGQCVSRDGNEIAQVDCADDKATYKVLLIQKDTTESSIESVCSGVPTTTTSYFESKEGETQGNVICLADLS